jgi:hypothetical protein
MLNRLAHLFSAALLLGSLVPPEFAGATDLRPANACAFFERQALPGVAAWFNVLLLQKNVGVAFWSARRSVTQAASEILPASRFYAVPMRLELEESISGEEQIRAAVKDQTDLAFFVAEKAPMRKFQMLEAQLDEMRDVGWSTEHMGKLLQIGLKVYLAEKIIIAPAQLKAFEDKQQPLFIVADASHGWQASLGDGSKPALIVMNRGLLELKKKAWASGNAQEIAILDAQFAAGFAHEVVHLAAGIGNGREIHMAEADRKIIKLYLSENGVEPKAHLELMGKIFVRPSAFQANGVKKNGDITQPALSVSNGTPAPPAALPIFAVPPTKVKISAEVSRPRKSLLPPLVARPSAAVPPPAPAPSVESAQPPAPLHLPLVAPRLPTFDGPKMEAVFSRRKILDELLSKPFSPDPYAAESTPLGDHSVDVLKLPGKILTLLNRRGPVATIRDLVEQVWGIVFRHEEKRRLGKKALLEINDALEGYAMSLAILMDPRTTIPASPSHSHEAQQLGYSA